MSSQGQTLDELLATTAPGNRSGCPVCGEKNVARVVVMIERLSANGNSDRTRGNTKSRSLSLCERHVIDLWLRVEAALEEGRGQ